MSVKLTDAQLVILSAAAQRGDLCLTAPPKMKGAVLAKVSEKLAKLGLVREVRAKTGMPVWRRDDAGRSYALKLTPTGLKAIAIDDGSEDAVARSGARPRKPQPVVDGTKAPGPAVIGERAKTAPRAGSKLSQVIDLIHGSDGATMLRLTEVTGWLPHTTRAALTGLRKRGYAVVRERTGGEIRSTASQAPLRPAQIASSSSPQRPRGPRPRGQSEGEPSGVIGMARKPFASRRPARQPAKTTPEASLPLDASVLSIVAGLEGHDLNGLRRQWRAHLGGEPPAHLPRWLLIRVLTYRLQADAFGGLDKPNSADASLE